MKSSDARPARPGRVSRVVTLRLRRLAGAAVVGSAVLVATTSAAPPGRVAALPGAAAGSVAASDPRFLPPVEPAPWTATEWSAPLGSLREGGPDLAATVAASAALGHGANGITAVASADTSEIPSAALAAYQRAAVVIDEAMPSCHLSWELLAAVGRVESDHGRFGGSVPDAEGVSTPAIIGMALTGRNGTSRVTDSDAGLLDADDTFDHAVGPMQFLPSTWSVVGVDADGDGERNPQDIDDAALAAAVYLCSNDDDLGTARGQHDAVFSYNRSESYVETVLALMKAYASGDSVVPVSATISTVQLGSTTGAVLRTGLGKLSKAVDRTAGRRAGATGPDGRDQASRGDRKPGTNGDGKTSTGDGKAGDEKAGDGKAGTSRPGGDKSDGSKPDQDKPGGNKPGGSTPDQNKPGGSTPDGNETPDPTTDPTQNPSTDPTQPQPSPTPGPTPTPTPDQTPSPTPSETDPPETPDPGPSPSPTAEQIAAAVEAQVEACDTDYLLALPDADATDAAAAHRTCLEAIENYQGDFALPEDTSPSAG